MQFIVPGAPVVLGSHVRDSLAQPNSHQLAQHRVHLSRVTKKTEVQSQSEWSEMSKTCMHALCMHIQNIQQIPVLDGNDKYECSCLYLQGAYTHTSNGNNHQQWNITFVCGVWFRLEQRQTGNVLDGDGTSGKLQVQQNVAFSYRHLT